MNDSSDDNSWTSASHPLRRCILIVSTIAWSWLGMMVVHECGHVLGAWMTGGDVDRVVLPPLGFSRTDLARNPHPLLVAWSGPVFGVIAPLATLALAAGFRWTGTHLLSFFAGLCLIANGAYLGVGWTERAGDASDLLAGGATVWQLCAFGAVCLPSGLPLWNGIGPRFGLGRQPTPVSAKMAYGSLALTVLMVTAELLFE